MNTNQNTFSSKLESLWLSNEFVTLKLTNYKGNEPELKRLLIKPVELKKGKFYHADQTTSLALSRKTASQAPQEANATTKNALQTNFLHAHRSASPAVEEPL